MPLCVKRGGGGLTNKQVNDQVRNFLALLNEMRQKKREPPSLCQKVMLFDVFAMPAWLAGPLARQLASQPNTDHHTLIFFIQVKNQKFPIQQFHKSGF